MVLASTDDATDLQKLADMADKIMEVATPSISAVSVWDSFGSCSHYFDFSFPDCNFAFVFVESDMNFACVCGI